MANELVSFLNMGKQLRRFFSKEKVMFWDKKLLREKKRRIMCCSERDYVINIDYRFIFSDDFRNQGEFAENDKVEKKKCVFMLHKEIL